MPGVRTLGGKDLRAALRKLERRKVRRFHRLWEEQFPRDATVQWLRRLTATRHAPHVARKPPHGVSDAQRIGGVRA